jgi:energy-coupling factor transporter ATP-binding protein EcfA2
VLRARDNPFAVERVLRLRYQFRDDDWSSLLQRLRSLNDRAAIVGPKGSGKTTLLEELAERLSARGLRIHRLFLNEQSRAYPADFVRRLSSSLGERDIILFDGCEQLSLPAWWRFQWATRRAGGLVITRHLPGRLPTLIECRTTRELFAELVGRLHDPAMLAPDMLDRLFVKHRGNLRDAIRELYDLAASDQALSLNANCSSTFSRGSTLPPTSMCG